MTGPSPFLQTEESRRAVNRMLLEAQGPEKLREQLRRRNVPEDEIERILAEGESTPDERGGT